MVEDEVYMRRRQGLHPGRVGAIPPTCAHTAGVTGAASRFHSLPGSAEIAHDLTYYRNMCRLARFFPARARREPRGYQVTVTVASGAGWVNRIIKARACSS